MSEPTPSPPSHHHLGGRARDLRCTAHDFHADYVGGVGTRALTLIAPLADNRQTDNFQLSYIRDTDSAKSLPSEDRVGRYVYRKGRAIVFGSSFVHSTEPGEGRDGEVHAFLGFTFGTDDPRAWPLLAKTLGTQSRIICRPDGELGLSDLGAELAAEMAQIRRGTPSSPEAAAALSRLSHAEMTDEFV